MPTAGCRTFVVAAVSGVLLASLAVADAGQDTVAYPAGYRTAFVEYGVIDAPAVKRVRIFYVAPEVLSVAAPGQPLPDGTVLVWKYATRNSAPGANPCETSPGASSRAIASSACGCRPRLTGRGSMPGSMPTGRA
jgi:hypothetical protein